MSAWRLGGWSTSLEATQPSKNVNPLEDPGFRATSRPPDFEHSRDISPSRPADLENSREISLSRPPALEKSRIRGLHTSRFLENSSFRGLHSSTTLIELPRVLSRSRKLIELHRVHSRSKLFESTGFEALRLHWVEACMHVHFERACPKQRSKRDRRSGRGNGFEAL